MKIYISIKKDDDSIYGVSVPDLPGCFSFGDTIDEAIQNAKEAIVGHLETLLELGEKVDLHGSSIEYLMSCEEYKKSTFVLIDI